PTVVRIVASAPCAPLTTGVNATCSEQVSPGEIVFPAHPVIEKSAASRPVTSMPETTNADIPRFSMPTLATLQTPSFCDPKSKSVMLSTGCGGDGPAMPIPASGRKVLLPEGPFESTSTALRIPAWVGRKAISTEHSSSAASTDPGEHPLPIAKSPG